MDAVVRKALAKNAEGRFQTAQEFADAIRSAAPAAAPAAGAAKSVAPSEPTIIAAPEPAVVHVSAPAPAAAGGAPSAVPPPSGKAPQVPALALALGAVVIAVGAGAWFLFQRPSVEIAKPAQSLSAPAAVANAPAPAPANTSAPAAAATPAPEPGTMTIAAVGLIDPSDPRYQSDKALMQSDLRADSKSQLVAKAVGLLLEPKSLAAHYDLIKSRLFANSGSFVRTVVRESEPRLGKDGLMSITTEAVVNVKAVQKSLNQMTRDERVELIRASGDPRISVQIDVRDADHPEAPPFPSPVAENMLKERIRSFGFRLWSEGGAGTGAADFAVIGQARVKRLSVRLEASGLTITKYTLTSWTVKCIDRATGEEIYYNTTLPKAVGSWASEEEALKAIGTRTAMNSRAICSCSMRT